MAKKNTPPSIRETAVDCPHCGAYATQFWFDIFASARERENRLPFIADAEFLEKLRADKDIPAEELVEHVKVVEKHMTGLVGLHENSERHYSSAVFNLYLSRCFNCEKFSVWIYDRLVFPAAAAGPSPNDDLPVGVRGDYEEASRILNLSPRGSAALLRLAIQKLCNELGEKGKNIDADIASLVKKGLSPLVQQALDAVRVIGNEAVHPGSLDLKDDTETASQLYRLLNIIVEQMISNPKHVREIFDRLPESKKKAIEVRDGKKTNS